MSAAGGGTSRRPASPPLAGKSGGLGIAVCVKAERLKHHKEAVPKRRGLKHFYWRPPAQFVADISAAPSGD